MMNIDTFNDRMDTAKYLSKALMRLDKYFHNNNHLHTVTSDCGDIEFNIVPNHNIGIQICNAKGESFKHTSRAATLYYNDISSANVINSTQVRFSPLNKACAVSYFYDYKIKYPYVHDEAQYFQNLTRYDLPDEYCYIAACELLQEIKDLEIVYMVLSLTDLRKDHTIAIDKLLQQMDL